MGGLFGKNLSEEVIFDLQDQKRRLVKIRETHVLGRKGKCADWKKKYKLTKNLGLHAF